MAEPAELPIDDVWTASGILDMRRQLLREVGLSLFVTGFVLTPIYPLVFGDIQSITIGLVLGMIVTGAATYIVSNNHPLVGTWVLLGGLSLLLTALSTILPAPVFLPWFGMLIVVGGFLGGPFVGIVLAIVGAAALLTGRPLGTLGLDLGLRASFAALYAAAATLGWLTFRPLLAALRWSWDNYLNVRVANQLLQERQGDLNRTLKSLNETLDRLDQVNQELDRARRAANQARQLKSEFAVNVSHELRTPLNLIIGFSEMMVTAPQSYQGQVLPPAYREDATAIYRSARHLSDLVDDILDLGQIEAGRMALRRELIQLGDVVAEGIETVRVLFSQKGLALDSFVPNELPAIFADRTRLRQIIINLLGNASRFTESGGARVSARLDERDIVMTVADTGSGIAPDDVPHVFDEFWQGSDPRRRAGGSGVGLAVSKRFVEMHGGSIWVESGTGGGTAFTFTIPRSTNLPEMAPPRPWDTWARVRKSAAEREIVAIVTDDADGAHLFERYLDDYAVVHASDATALSVMPQPPHLSGIVVVAPDALTAHRRGLAIQVRRPQTPVVACGFTSTRLSLAERLGVAEYLVKPIGRERLTRILRQLGRSTRRLLVVDDERDAARLLARMIRSVSRTYHVEIAFGGAEALRLLEDTLPDAIFVDLIMPDVDGYTLIETIHGDSRLAAIPLVAVSAQALSIDPLASDGLTLLQPGGMPIGNLIDSVRFALRQLSADPEDKVINPRPIEGNPAEGRAEDAARDGVASQEARVG